jgi:hypothetical protein
MMLRSSATSISHDVTLRRLDESNARQAEHKAAARARVLAAFDSFDFAAIAATGSGDLP